jgi:hypothetical protein
LLAAETNLVSWWNAALHATPPEYKRSVAAALIYTAWNLWKERNRRIFDQVSVLPAHVLVLIKEEIKLRDLACGEDVLPHRGF